MFLGNRSAYCYSYLSIRGFPQRRISVLVNGVPLNDPESHEVYWIDHPDLLASTAEAGVQRGVGAALYGAASLGGGVNVETVPFGDTPRVSAVLGAGSFDTRRGMLELDSGRLAGNWNLSGNTCSAPAGLAHGLQRLGHLAGQSRLPLPRAARDDEVPLLMSCEKLLQGLQGVRAADKAPCVLFDDHTLRCEIVRGEVRHGRLGR